MNLFSGPKIMAILQSIIFILGVSGIKFLSENMTFDLWGPRWYIDKTPSWNLPDQELLSQWKVGQQATE